MSNVLHAPPPPVGPDAARQLHTRLRRRVLYGQWENDLQRRIQRHVGQIRREAWGPPSLSANMLGSVSSQLATLYDQPVSAVNALAGGAATAERFATLLEDAALWELMQRVQRDTLGMREMLVRVDVSDAGALRYRPAFPDLVELEPHPDDPMRPRRVVELRQREVFGRIEWVYDVLELHETADGAVGSYRVFKRGPQGVDEGKEISGPVLGGAQIGDGYPYRYDDGAPFLPYALYHAQTTGSLWDAWEWNQVLEATLDVGVLWSFWMHVVKDASWPQRYASGVQPRGASVVGDSDTTRRTELTTDPSTVVLFDGDPDSAAQPSIGQWQPGGDPKELGEAIAAFERRVISLIDGMTAADVQRMSGDPRSGYALTITRSAQRRAQRRLMPTFARSDRDLLRKSAALWNRWAEANEPGLPRLPERGWRAKYEPIPLSPEERAALIDEVERLLGLGMIDKIDALRRLIGEGMSRREAERELDRIAAASEPGPPPAPAPPPPPDAGDAEADEQPIEEEGDE